MDPIARTLVRGEASSLAEHHRRLVASSEVLDVRPAGTHRCWSSVRHLVAQLRDRVGDRTVDAILDRHAAVAARLPGLTTTRPSEGDAPWPAASVESHLSHNILVQRPLFDAAAALLADLLDGIDAPLLVENLADLDRESLAALRALYRRFADRAPALVAGYDPHQGGGEPDADGVIWQNPAADIHTVALGFAALPGSRVIDLPAAGSGVQGQVSEPIEPPRSTAGLDDRAWTILDSTTGGIEPAAIHEVIAAIDACFACFGFTAALRLGLALLDHSPQLSREQTASLHGTLALAAHNRQFRSDGNHALAHFLDHHLVHALAAETRPARRSCLCYRLAVTLGRRRKQFDVGLDWADQAVDEARLATDASPLQRAHLEAWGRNIRAYVLLGLRRADEARVDCEAAFARIDEAIESPLAALRDPDPLTREAGFTHSLLADNLAALAKFADDAEGFARWKAIADEIAQVAPGLVRFEAILWVDLYRAMQRYDLALAKAAGGLEAAVLEGDPLRAFNYAVQLADLHDRRGDAEAAATAFDRAIEIAERLGRPAFLRPMEGYAAVAWLRAGEVERARRLLEGGLDRLASSEPTRRAELVSRLAWLEAIAGHGALAEERIDAAIEAAVESGSRRALVDVAVQAGRTAAELGRSDEAASAYGRALALIGTALGTATGTGDEPTLAAPAFAAQLGLAALGDTPDERIIAALRLWSAAASDATAWWDLPLLWRAIREPARPLAERLAADELAPAVAAVRRAADQRLDCQHESPRLRIGRQT